MFNSTPLKIVFKKIIAFFVFQMLFFITNVIAEVDNTGLDVPIMLKYKQSISPSLNVGELPFHRAFQVIDWQSGVSNDGAGERPVWKKRYEIVKKDKYTSIVSEKTKQARVLELIYFIQMIQKSNN